MNTDPIATLDLAGAVDAVGSAESGAALSAALQQLAAAAGMPSYLLLHLHGPDNQVAAVLHNLALAPLVDGPAITTVVQRALASRRFPEVVEVDVPGLQHGASAMWQEGLTTCVLLLGQDVAIEAEAAMDLLGIASLAASHAAHALAKLLKAECPLTIRELECLVYAASGCSAKDTGRHLQLSPRTVEEYLARCKERMGVRSTLAAAATALRRGWISNQDIDAAGAAINRRYAADRK